MHYKLQLENYEKGSKVFTRGQECKSVYFVVNGELELVVEQHETDYLLDVLDEGSVVGAYSMINESIF